jgi:hypothetical protein
VDTLKNVADSLTKSVSTEKFSWCRGSMGIATMDCLLYNPVTPCMQRKQQVGECWVCVIFFALFSCLGKRVTYLGGFSAHGFFVDGFLFPVKELGLLTNPSHWVKVLDVVGYYMYIVL